MDSQALFGVDFRVAENEVVALVGRNGAGKTTILRAIMGLLPRLSGRVIVHGRETTTLRPSQRARLGLGYCPEERAVFASLTVSENIALPPVLGSQAMTEEEIFGLFPKLRARRGHFGGQLSGGEQQMLAIGRILRTGAKILILDEPTEGLSWRSTCGSTDRRCNHRAQAAELHNPARGTESSVRAPCCRPDRGNRERHDEADPCHSRSFRGYRSPARQISCIVSF